MALPFYHNILTNARCVITHNLENIQKVLNKNILVEEIMNINTVCVSGDKTLPELLEIFNNLQKGYLPVCNDNGVLLGLITRSSLISVLSSQYIEIGDDN